MAVAMIDLELIKTYWPAILTGLGLSLQVTAVAFVVGLSLGSVLGVLQAKGPKPLRWLVMVYATLFRGTPMLVQISFFYFFLPLLGLSLPALVAACIAIGLNSSAYISQIIRSGIISVSQDELDAAQVLGFSAWQKARYILLPQALRNTLPALTNESITLLKDSSLASVIGVAEVYKELRHVLNETYDVATVFFLLAAIYLLLTGTISLLSYALEKRFSYA